jgi:hypothetical protein
MTFADSTLNTQLDVLKTLDVTFDDDYRHDVDMCDTSTAYVRARIRSKLVMRFVTPPDDMDARLVRFSTMECDEYEYAMKVFGRLAFGFIRELCRYPKNTTDLDRYRAHIISRHIRGPTVVNLPRMFSTVNDTYSMIQNIDRVDAETTFMSEMGTLIPPHVLFLFNTTFAVFTIFLIRVDIGGIERMAVMNPLSPSIMDPNNDDKLNDRLTILEGGRLVHRDASDMFIELDDVRHNRHTPTVRFVDYVTHHHYARRIQRTWRRYRAALKI